MSYKVKYWCACHPHRAHEESFLARQELVKRGQVVLCFSLEHSLDVTELPFSMNLLFVLLFCFVFSFRIFLLLLLTFSCLNWASRDPHLTILLLFVTLPFVPFVPYMIVLYRLSHSAFSARSSLLGSLCQGYKAVLFQSRAGFLAWILGSQPAKSIQKNTGLDAISCPSLWEP